MEKLRLYLKEARINQWIKNSVVFTGLIFSGGLFEIQYLSNTIYAFLVFCFLSSTSYILNDILDYNFDKKHPFKKKRPIASGKISIAEGTFLVFILVIISLVASLYFSVSLFILAFSFLILHFFYSMYLKNFPILDMFAIAISFMMRAFAGEIVSGYHIPIWLVLTIFFGALFIATVKRHAELVSQGTETRSSLYSYKEHLLLFLTNTFATATIIAYSSYTYFFEVQQQAYTKQNSVLDKLTFLENTFLRFELRKWMMITIPFVVYGIARYAQLLYEKEQGERPEKIITTDIPLIATMAVWGLMVVLFIYVF